MNYIVLPLLRHGRGPFDSSPAVLNGVLIHMFGVGLPASLAALAASAGEAEV